MDPFINEEAHRKTRKILGRILKTSSSTDSTVQYRLEAFLQPFWRKGGSFALDAFFVYSENQSILKS